MGKIKTNLIAGLTASLVLIGPISFGDGLTFRTTGISSNLDLPDLPELPKIERPERPERPEFISDEIIVKFKGDARPFRVIKVPRGRVGEKITQYLKRSDVLYAEPNYILYASMVPNDPYYSYQWHLDNSVYGGINTEAAWNISTGSGVVVAVIDSGISQGTDLADTCFVSGYDFVNNDSNPADDNGHGTHIAGTIAQSTNNNHGVAGIAFNACLMPIKVLNRYGSGSYSNAADGVRWAADNGADVINLSLGGIASSRTLEEAVTYAYNKGVTMVAAAGNSGASRIDYPAAYDEVISVGATQYDENRASYSNYGPGLDLVAPGGNLDLDQNNDGYGDGILQQSFTSRYWWRTTWGYYFADGTSMAVPHVVGVAALAIANGNASSPDQLRDVLVNSAEDLGPAGWDNNFGWGLVDAAAALQSSQEPDSDGDGVVDSQDVCLNVYGTYCHGCPEPSCSGCQSANCPAEGEPICLDDDSSCFTSNAVGTCSAGSCSYECISGYDNCDGNWANGCEIDLNNDSNNCGECGSVCGVVDCPASGCGVNGCSQEEYGSYPASQQTTCLAGTCSGQCAVTCQYSAACDLDDDNDGVLDSDDACPNTYGTDCNGCPNSCSGCAIMFCQEGTLNPPTCQPGTCPETTCPADGCGVGSCPENEYGSYTPASNTCQLVGNLGTCTENPCSLECSYNSICQVTEETMHVGDISFDADIFTIGRWGSWCRVYVTVPILDESAKGVNGANVSGRWSGAYNRSVSGSTNSQGEVTFKTSYVRGCGTFTFAVSNLTKSDWLYDPSTNLETSDSVTLP